MDDKINDIIKNQSFQNNLSKIEELEKNRKYCLHDMQHFLDVARLMYIISLENDLSIPKYIIYTTALLHDIGRGEQYENGTAHNIASVSISKKILHQCTYADEEIDKILYAIGNHRNDTESFNVLSDLLYKGDKLSRNCNHCTARVGCKWPQEKKNMKITY
ncbi:HD domain-containing protein [Clostridium algoriphilum]|uniref:HD domain-containing protein n=1 Tax=Clostridium algoriphilum TaxID=198347 RepID=UPI001CF431AF|nr:HD domain-containing protein [Clostridium algoriphilum]MCB2292490.1 HD domain-containing protein [Clostridium algoriphilum]